MILVMENPSAPRSLTKSLTLSKDPDLPILFTKRSIQEFGTVPLTYGEKFGDELVSRITNSVQRPCLDFGTAIAKIASIIKCV
jgi:hypothetical protein